MAELQETDNPLEEKVFPPISRTILEQLAKSKEAANAFVDKMEDFLNAHDSLGDLFLGVFGQRDEQMGTEMYVGAGAAILVECYLSKIESDKLKKLLF